MKRLSRSPAHLTDRGAINRRQTHTHLEPLRGGCHLLSNLRSYPVRVGRFENAAFSVGLVVEVPTEASCYG